MKLANMTASNANQSLSGSVVYNKPDSHVRHEQRKAAYLSLLLISSLSLLGFWLRLTHLGTHSLWYDELLELDIAQRPLNQIWSHLNLHAAMPLDYYILWSWVDLGRQEIWVRWPALLWGTLSIPLVYLLGRRLFNRQTGYIAASLMAWSEFALRYSQETRPYALLTLLVMLGFLGLWQAYQTQDLRYWGLTAFGFLGAISSHYFALFTLIPAGLFVGLNQIYRPRQRLIWRNTLCFSLLIAFILSTLLIIGRLNVLYTVGYQFFDAFRQPTQFIQPASVKPNQGSGPPLGVEFFTQKMLMPLSTENTPALFIYVGFFLMALFSLLRRPPWPTKHTTKDETVIASVAKQSPRSDVETASPSVRSDMTNLLDDGSGVNSGTIIQKQTKVCSTKLFSKKTSPIRNQQGILLLLGWLIIPPLLVYLFLLHRGTFYAIRYILYVLPAFLILVAYGLYLTVETLKGRLLRFARNDMLAPPIVTWFMSLRGSLSDRSSLRLQPQRLLRFARNDMVMVGLSLGLLAPLLIAEAQEIRTYYQSPSYEDWRAVGQILRANTQPGDAVITIRAEQATNWYYPPATAPFRYYRTSRLIWEKIDKHPRRWFILSSYSYRYDQGLRTWLKENDAVRIGIDHRVVIYFHQEGLSKGEMLALVRTFDLPPNGLSYHSLADQFEAIGDQETAAQFRQKALALP